MNFQTIDVTPKQAEQWLSQMGKNRTLNKRHVKKLAMEMQAGKWVLTGDTVKLTSDGRLIDGQHRLNALLESGLTSIPMAICFGVDHAQAFEAIDVNVLKRGADQIAQMEGIDNASLKVAVARRLLIWDAIENKQEFTLSTNQFSTTPTFEVNEYLRNHNGEITEVFSQIKGAIVFKSCRAPSALVAALVICHVIDEVATMVFIDSLRTGAHLTATSPIMQLRDKLSFQSKKIGGVMWETEVMAMTIKAWNYFVREKSIKELRWRHVGDVPEKFPIPYGGASKC